MTPDEARLWREYWSPLLVWVGLTQLFSSDILAYSETSRVIEPLLRSLLPTASAETIALLHAAVRKFGHVAEFFVMGVLASRAVRVVDSSPSAILVAGAFVASAAMIDELGQLLTAHRGASPTDVGYDCLGGMIGVRLWWNRPRRLE